jgi:hypothetical protein
MTHITDVVNVIKWEDLKDICLVAHSYGGWPGSGALEQIGDRVSSIVWLDAFKPEKRTASVVSTSPRTLAARRCSRRSRGASPVGRDQSAGRRERQRGGAPAGHDDAVWSAALSPDGSSGLGQVTDS